MRTKLPGLSWQYASQIHNRQAFNPTPTPSLINILMNKRSYQHIPPSPTPYPAPLSESRRSFVLRHRLKLEILAELHRPEAHIWGDRRRQPIRSATGSELESR